MPRKTWLTILASALAAGLVMTGCARGDGEPSEPATEPASQVEDTFTEGMVHITEAGEPKQGGTLTWIGLSEPRSLDPAQTLPAATTGGMELINIYDTLLRYDAESGSLVPQLAEKVEANDDHSEFTITLREGVAFSDGTPLDAEAVVWSMERYGKSERAPEGILWNANVAEIAATDDLTVVITLHDSYPRFTNMLSTGPGMIVAPSSEAGAEFAPIGAGPFTLERFAPSEEIVLAANPNYWNGAPYLDQLRTIVLGDQIAGLESLDAGQVQSVLLSNPDLIIDHLTEGTPGYLNFTSSWAVALINANEGRPGADPRVRKAMALALDPSVVTERAYGGAGDVSPGMLSSQSQWYSPDSGQFAYDPDEARRLLEEAKADGYDGSFTYQSSPDAKSRDVALALKAQWEAVGFTVTVDTVRNNADLIGNLIAQDYDVSRSGLNIREFDPYAKISLAMRTGGSQTYGTYTSEERDALIDDLKLADTDEELHEALTKLQQQLGEEVPYIPHAHSWEFSVWAPNVHGATGAANSMILWDKAWIE